MNYSKSLCIMPCVKISWYINRDVTNIWVLAHFEFKTQRFYIKNYVESICAKLFEIFSDAYIGTKCLKKLNKKNFQMNYISSFYVSNCFKCFLLHILGQNVTKIRQEKIWTISSGKMFQYFHIVYIPKHYSVKIVSISFFSSSDMQKFHHVLWCLTIGINFSFNFF